MKILMICGSPRGEDSTSNYMLQIVEEKLQNIEDNRIRIIYDYKEVETVKSDLLDASIILIAFPLYVDGIPASFLDVLQKMEEAVKDEKPKGRVYALVNNGFYDAKQNNIAIDMIWKWCDKCGFDKGYAIGVGAGGIIRASSMGVGPNINLGRALNQLIKDMYDETKKETIYVEPNFPRSLYKLAAHVNWRKTAKANGLKVKELRRKLINKPL